MSKRAVISSQLLGFLSTQIAATIPKSQWFLLAAGEGEAYMRAGRYAFDPGDRLFHTCIGLSHIVIAPNFRQTGIFKRLLAEAVEQAIALGYERVRAEEVSYDWLMPCIERAGFVRLPGEGSPTFELVVGVHHA